MRTLYRCQSVANYSDWQLVQLLAASDGITGHNEFTNGKPSGLVELTITRQAEKGYFVPGNDYFLDFTPKEPA